MSKNRKSNVRAIRLLKSAVGSSDISVWSLPSGDKGFTARIYGDLPADLEHVNRGQYDQDIARAEPVAHEIAAKAIADLATIGIASEYKEHFLTLPLPVVTFAERDQNGKPLRPLSENVLVELRAITGPHDPAFARFVSPEASRGDREFAYKLLKTDLKQLEYLAWEDNDSPFEDEHWIAVRYTGIAVHVTGVVPTALIAV